MPLVSGGPIGARVWARRAIVTMLAGGGMTAAGLGGPLSGGAVAAESPAGATPPQGAPTNPGAETTTSGEGQTTATTPAPSIPPATTAPTSTSTTTVPATTPSTTTTTATPVTPKPGRGPKVLTQHVQQSTEAPAGEIGEKGQKVETNKKGSAGSKPASPPAAPSAPATSEQIAPAPGLVRAQSGALAALVSGSSVAQQALGFYRIPLFLLPIYQAAAAQYGVPWQVLAAINEVETNYGADLSVSSAGAVGWMQFMPETWLQYGVDAVNAGYADPYNPIDAIFAAARYLQAAGAASNLHAAILAYNHSEAYVESVLLRARLIGSYPAPVIATLTGLTEGRMPVTGARLSAVPSGPSSATAGAAPVEEPSVTTPIAATAGQTGPTTPGSPPPPRASAAAAQRTIDSPVPADQLSTLAGADKAPVVAVEDGRIVAIGRSRELGRYVVLRDTYGDVFTYAGLGSIAPHYSLDKPAQTQTQAGAGSGSALTQAANSEGQPLTVHVAAKAQAGHGPMSSAGPVIGGIGKVRVFANPDNPDARARAARVRGVAGWSPLVRGADVAKGTVLGHLGTGGESTGALLRFAIRPAGDPSAIDPRPILENWRQLDAALHPKGARAAAALAGATASDAFTMSKPELERAVLADPDMALGACDRRQITAGQVDRRVLATLVFLSRSGLKPTVSELRCGRAVHASTGVVTMFPAADTLGISAINGVPIAGHQGAGTITDMTIRALLAIEGRFAPARIVSLMKYPGASSTVANPEHGGYIELEFPTATAAHQGARGRAVASAARHVASTPGNVPLSSTEWQRLIERIQGLPRPWVSRKPSTAAIRDARASSKAGKTAPGEGG